MGGRCLCFSGKTGRRRQLSERERHHIVCRSHSAPAVAGDRLAVVAPARRLTHLPCQSTPLVSARHPRRRAVAVSVLVLVVVVVVVFFVVILSHACICYHRRRSRQRLLRQDYLGGATTNAS